MSVTEPSNTERHKSGEKIQFNLVEFENLETSSLVVLNVDKPSRKTSLVQKLNLKPKQNI